MTGRNDLCPCGSGKKYKRCCLSKQVHAPSQAPAFARQQIEEVAAFEQLLEQSEPFRRYYEEVRPRLSGFTVAYDPLLPVGVRARTTQVDGKRYLRLRKTAGPTHDAALIAHELGHFLLDERGFPAVGGLNDHPAAAALNSAVQDPLIDAELATYGFDCAGEREAEIVENMRQLAPIKRPPNDQAGRAHWVANYLGHILDRCTLGPAPAMRSTPPGSSVAIQRSLQKRKP